ncbi:MAG: D-sedoheptulose 7-phosphate isomerase [bacterium]
MIRDSILKALHHHAKVVGAMESVIENIETAVVEITDTLQRGNKLLLAGNGGSAADAQHWAAEWMIRLSHDLQRPGLAAIALTTDTSILTAGANDIGFENVFARQIEALAQQGDLVILISTSGNSGNLLKAAETAREKGAKTLGILGNRGGKMNDVCDFHVIVPSDDTQRIQEMHSLVGHLLCELSERALFQK